MDRHGQKMKKPLTGGLLSQLVMLLGYWQTTETTKVNLHSDNLILSTTSQMALGTDGNQVLMTDQKLL